MMKNENGISLITLLVTVVIMIIITSITMYSGFEAYDSMKVQAFVGKMKSLQERIDIYCDKYSVREINAMGTNYDEANPKAKEVLDKVIASNAMGELKSWTELDNATANYRYFGIEDIETKIGVKDFDVGIWLNPLTRNVIAVEGIEYEGKMYYRQYDLAGGQKLEQPIINTDTQLTYSIRTYDNKADIILDKKYAKVTCYLKNDAGNSIVSTQIFTHVDSFSVTQSGNYQIVATDYDRNVNDYSDYSEDVRNKFAGLEKTSGDFTLTIVNKPLLIDGMIPIDSMGRELLTEEDKKDWYNYDSTVKNWANAKLADGSIYVWIPRFAYKVENGQMFIKFLSEFSTLTTEGQVLDVDYKIAPAFQNGSGLVPKSFANGEWDSELSGFWVAKYEASKNNEYPISIEADVEAWRLKPKDAFNVCRLLEKSTDLFGELAIKPEVTMSASGVYANDINNFDTHLMKNSEYGAVTYLAVSKYGGGNIACQEGVYPGKNCTVNASTTGNNTGIYGLAGGNAEVVAGGINIKGIYNKDDITSGNLSTKYASGYVNNETIYGDAILKTEVGSWTENVTRVMPDATKSIFTRGGSGANATVWDYDAITTDNASCAFRPVLTIEY